MQNALTVADLSKVLFEFYNNYINTLPYYHITKPTNNCQLNHIVIDISKPIKNSIEEYPKAYCRNTLEEAFASNYRLIPPFYNYSSYDRSNFKNWKSYLLVPQNVFLGIIWSNILCTFYIHGCLQPVFEKNIKPIEFQSEMTYAEKEKFFKESVFEFLTKNNDEYSIGHNSKITEHNAIMILQNVKKLLDYIYKDYKNPTEKKLEINLKNFQNMTENYEKMKKNYQSLNKKFKELKKQNKSIINILDEVNSVRDELEKLDNKIQTIILYLDVRSDDFK